MPNSLCRDVEHGWREMTVKGWFRCARLGCAVYAVCPACVLCVPKGRCQSCVKDTSVSRGLVCSAKEE
jgi:hypothetical protein